MIEIKSISGELLFSVPVLADAVSHEELMTSDYVQLSWSSDKGYVLPVGSYIEHDGERFTLLENYTPTRVNEVEFKYVPQFQSRIMRWQKTIVPVYNYEADGVTIKTRELDWTFTGTPEDALFMVQQTIKNELGETWDVSIAVDLPETITISSQSSSIWSILSEIADLCETEWWADKSNNLINLNKCEHGSKVTLEVGVNVKTPTMTPNADGYFTRFYAFGSSRNVTQSDGVVQGSIVNKRLTLDPKKYPNGYKDIKGHFENGVFVSDLLPEEVFAMPLYFEDVYPSSNLSISNVRRRMRYRTNSDGEKIQIGGTEEEPIYDQYAIWYFQIAGFEYSEELVIKGQTLSVHFKSGQLRGREFELAYHGEDKKVADKDDVDINFSVKAGDYEIIFDEQTEEFIIPSADYMIPQNGDEVTLFNIEMPSEYTSSAMEKLERELDKEIERRAEDNNSYEFNSNPVAFYEDETEVALGQRVAFVNNGKTLNTRVLMVEQHLDYGFDQKIRVGNTRIVGSRQQLRDEVREVGKEVSDLNNQSDNIAKIQRAHQRRFSEVKETIGMLEKAMLEGFGESISPITINTMSMLVGDESLQFRFVDNTSDPTQIPSTVRYVKEGKRIVSDGDIIQHMTLGITDMSPRHDISAYKFWEVYAPEDCVLEDDTKAYYLYIKASKEDDTAEYIVSQSAIGMEEVDGYYHFLTAILNSATEEGRNIAFLNGFTEILPSQITTGAIRSSDGNTWLDLLKGILHLNNAAGISGVKTEEKGDKSIAAWFGGAMEDKELDEGAENPAMSVIRHDGTGYFAGGNIRWGKEGEAEFGGGDFKIMPDGSIVFGKDIKVSAESDETLGTILTALAVFNDMFYKTEDGKAIGTKYNFFSEGEISANGLSLGGGISGGGLIKNVLGVSSLGTVASEDNTTTFSAYAIDSIYKRLVELEKNGGGGGNVDVDLSDYYTKDEVNRLFTKENIQEKLGISAWALKSSLAASDVPNLPWSKITSGKPTTLAGYGITDAMAKSDYFDINNGNAYIGDGACNIYVRGELQSWPSAWSITKAGAASFKSLSVNNSSVLTASDLDDYGFLTGISKSMVTNALGYTPFNSASFTKANIKSTLGISDWALASSKPSYSYSEINGAPDNLSDLTDDILDGYYLKLTGGTISGNLTVNKNLVIGSATLSWKSSALEVNKPFYSTGEISANGLYLGSDMRFKDKIEDISLDLDTIANAPMFRFTWNNREDSREHIGSSAQYWKEHARELVSIDDKDFHRLDYSTLGVLMGISLAKKIKELEMKIGG